MKELLAKHYLSSKKSKMPTHNSWHSCFFYSYTDTENDKLTTQQFILQTLGSFVMSSCMPIAKC